MDPSVFVTLLKIIFAHRKRYFKALFMLILSNALLILNPLLFRQAVIALDPSSTTASSKQFQFIHYLLDSSLFRWAGLILILAALSAVLRYWMRVGFISISRDAERETREQLFLRIQSQSRAFFDRHGVGELLSRLTNDITVYRDMLGPGILYPLYSSTLVIPGMIALFYISPPLALLSLLPLLAIPVLNAAIRSRNLAFSHQVQAQLGHLSDRVQEHYAGIKIIKGYAVEREMEHVFEQDNQKLARSTLKMATLQGALLPMFTLVTRLTTVILVLVAALLILKAEPEISLADFVSFMWIQSYIFFPVLMLGWVLPVYERGRAAYARLVELYNEPIEVQDNPTSSLPFPKKADISIRDLTFQYGGEEAPALKNITLDIQAGAFVGITGPVGGGKTTLLQILGREYEIPFGVLFMGGHEIHGYSLKTLRRETITVEQMSFLFSRTVADNVRFSRREASQEELEMASQYADLHDTVMEFPDRYETMVGERGLTLSGGQRQRVAIARALLVKRSLILLDDIFSAVDAATERRIFQSIKKQFKGTTVILVTHRVSLLEQMDRVIYLSEGVIKEDGPPKELLRRGGYFSTLAELQQFDIKEPK